jgi:hypothetical protein
MFLKYKSTNTIYINSVHVVGNRARKLGLKNIIMYTYLFIHFNFIKTLIIIGKARTYK